MPHTKPEMTWPPEMHVQHGDLLATRSGWSRSEIALPRTAIFPLVCGTSDRGHDVGGGHEAVRGLVVLVDADAVEPDLVVEDAAPPGTAGTARGRAAGRSCWLLSVIQDGVAAAAVLVVRYG